MFGLWLFRAAETYFALFANARKNGLKAPGKSNYQEV